MDKSKYLFSSETLATSKMVVACFVDIRGFTLFFKSTEGSPREGVKLLNGFYNKVNRAFEDVKKNLSVNSEFGKKIYELGCPTLGKKTGDGIMFIWEYPDTNDESIELGFKIFILDFIHLMQDYFYDFKKEFSFNHPFLAQDSEKLEIGIGLSWGQAWKLSEPNSKNIDYVGTCINKAARLQDLARPYGLVADFSFLSNFFLERWSMNAEGDIKYEELKGINDPTLVWKATGRRTILPRCSRCSNSFREARLSITRENLFNEIGIIPLSLDDTKNIFDIRESFEAEFATSTAKRKKEKEIDKELEIINPEQPGEPFHMGIAKLSTSNISEGKEKSEFIDWAYTSTRRLNIMAKANEKDAPKQHAEIFRAICEGNSLLVEKLMRDHIRNACIEGQAELFEEKRKEFSEEKRLKKLLEEKLKEFNSNP